MTPAPTTIPDQLLRALRPVPALALLVAASASLLAGAWYFQLVIGLLPCKLCLEQRWPHYAALVLGLAGLAAAVFAGESYRKQASRLVLWLLAGLFVISAAMGSYHAGVEWGWFVGPSDCGGAALPAAGSMQDFMKQLQTTRVVSCTEAAWRLAGLSLAGWNAVFSAGLALLAGLSAWRDRG